MSVKSLRLDPFAVSIIGAALLLLFAFDNITVGEEVKPKVPQPKVDERVELLGIVFRLGGAQEYQSRSFKEYDDTIKEHFAAFNEHPIIQSVSRLRQSTGVSYDAVMSYAIHISIEDGRIVLPDTDSEKTLEHLDSRWKPQEAKLFAEQLDDFYVKSRFHDFFEANHEMRKKTEQKIKDINDTINYAWFKEFYGDAPLERFHFLLSNVNEHNNYGARCRFKDGHEEYFAIIGTGGPNRQYRIDGITSLVIHEFNHSFCNPLVEKHLDQLQPAAEKVFPFVADTLSRQAYGSAKTILYEYLVRACEIRYFLGQGRKNEADRRIQEHRNIGFLWIEELVELLGRYEKERDKYPMLADFMPEIVKMQNAIVTDEYIAELRKQKEERDAELERNRPQISATSPPNGATDVDPNITEIVVTFDRPMGDGMAWCRRDPPETYPKHSPATWRDERTCVASDVVLEPGKTYIIWLNMPGFYGFRSSEGVEFPPVRYTFTTQAE